MAYIIPSSLPAHYEYSFGYTSEPVMFLSLLKNTLLLLLVGGGSCANPTLPVVDLGYVKQRATAYNETYDFYVYRNIRYAAPPLGDLRFRKPQPPIHQDEIQDGDIPIEQTFCHQTYPPFLPQSPFGETFGVEDCLVGYDFLLQIDSVLELMKENWSSFSMSMSRKASSHLIPFPYWLGFTEVVIL
jgi:Carboxylesterase family